MELKQGYKQTEIGVIPEDWEVYTFGDIVDYTKGFPFKSEDYMKHGTRIIRVSDTTFDGIKNENGIYVDNKDVIKYRNWRLEENDLIFTTVGSKPPMYDSMVGKVIMVPKEFAGSLLNQNAVLIRSKNKTKEKQALLLSNFRMKRYLQHIELIYRGNANQASVTLKELFEFQIPIPNSLTEQIAIANALTDIDTLIIKTEKRIEKKKAIKQGAIQELLKPNEGWVTKRLGEIGKTYGGLSGKSKVDFANGNAFYIPFMNVMSSPTININFFDSVNIRAGEKQNKAQIADLFFNGSSETPEEVGMCSVLTKQIDNLYLNSFCFGYRLNDIQNYNGLFLAYYFRSDFGRAAIFSLAQGATRYNLSKGNFLKMEIPIPELQIQNEIAGCLADMDSELKKITFKLTKLKQQKQGMMQALLTGKIRLI